MVISKAELEGIAAPILNAPKDKFGLETDGNGIVVLPSGIIFLDKILDLEQKYLVLGEEDHGAAGTPFTDENASIFKAHGITKIHSEMTPQALQLIKQHSDDGTGGKSNAEKNAVAEYRTLTKNGLGLNAIDPRDVVALGLEHVEIVKMLGQIDQLKVADQILNFSANTVKKITDKDVMKQTLDLISHQVFGTNPPTKDASLAAQQQLCMKAVQGLGAISSPSKVPDVTLHWLMLLAKNTPEAATERANMSAADIQAMAQGMHRLLNDFEMAATLRMNQELKAAKTDPNLDIAKAIITNSQNDPKAVIRWGFGHFSTKTDIDEILGEENTIVVMTANTTEQFGQYLQRIASGKYQDPPDYLYMPAYKNTQGIAVPEQAISVAEYLATHAQPGKTPPPSKQNGRG